MKYMLLAVQGAAKAIEEILDKVFSGIFYAIGAAIGFAAALIILEKFSQ